MITEEQIRQALVEVIREFGPDHRAPRFPAYDDEGDRQDTLGCRYVVDNQPSCLAGVVCFRLGIADLETLDSWDHQGDAEMTSETITSVAQSIPDLDGAALEMLRKAQAIQDGVGGYEVPASDPFGVPWGDVAYAMGLEL